MYVCLCSFSIFHVLGKGGAGGIYGGGSGNDDGENDGIKDGTLGLIIGVSAFCCIFCLCMCLYIRQRNVTIMPDGSYIITAEGGGGASMSCRDYEVRVFHETLSQRESNKPILF